MRVYHVTPSENVPAILREGLVADDEATRPGTPPTIHLADSPRTELIQSLFATRDVTTLEVDLTDMPVEPGWDGDGTYAVLMPIAPWRVRKL